MRTGIGLTLAWENGIEEIGTGMLSLGMGKNVKSHGNGINNVKPRPVKASLISWG